MPPRRALLPLTLGCSLAAAVACGSTDSPSIDPGTGPDADGGTSGTLPDGAAKPGTDGSTVDPDGAQPTTGIKTVFIILMENHSWATIKGAGASAGYINGTLLPMGAHAEAYSTPPGNHPSEPNYVWLEAGDNLGITNDNPPSANHKATKDHLTAQLEAKGVTWKAYAEGAPAGVCPLTASGLYDPKHTPQLFFDDVTDTNQASSMHCIDHVRPYTELDGDLTANKVARYNFITPDLCNDMHGNGFSGACSLIAADKGKIKLGDDWLAAQVPKIMASAAYKDNGVIFVLWDEGEEAGLGAASDGPIGLIALSPLAKPAFASSTPFTHSSMLRTLEAIFGVPYLRGAQGAQPLAELFTAFP
ncbi:MAG TPA: alkaline phosphatase family protein [Labilithrix sp.]|nr:alkaline phosphatase family protein [Labilithrix sp.]